MYFFSQLLSAIEIEKLYVLQFRETRHLGGKGLLKDHDAPLFVLRDLTRELLIIAIYSPFLKGLDYNHDSSIFQGVRFYDRL